MTATITDIDLDRRHFAEYLAAHVLYYVKHRYAVWPFEGEGTEDVYRWARTEGNAKFRALELPAILRHITGIKTSRGVFSGIGVPALADAGRAGIGVIDIDTHTSGTVVDLAAIAAVCDPAAVVTRSSSGRGVHIYFFPPTPVSSHVLRLALDRYIAYLLGNSVIPIGAQIDVFPKGHGVDGPDPAERILAGGSVRFPFAAGRRVKFVTYPEAWDKPCDHPGEIYWGGRWVTDFKEKQRIIAMAQAEHLSWLATWAGPPCIGMILKDGADEGERNTLIFDAAYFAAFATQDEVVATTWVWDRIIPKLRGSEIAPREGDRTIRSGIDHALDPTQPQYVCTTTLCNKAEGRCLRLGQPTASGYTAGAAAAAAAVEEQHAITVSIVSDAGPNSLSVRDGALYIGDTFVGVEYCPIDEKYHIRINTFLQRFTPAGLLHPSTALGILASMLQRDLTLPRGARTGWLARLLLLARQVAIVFRHPAYGQLKTALYSISQVEGDSVLASAVHEAMILQRSSISIDAAMRNYPGGDWFPVISPENEVLGMRLVALDHDFLAVVPKTPPPSSTPPKTSPTDY